jgi:hypothetical protein
MATAEKTLVFDSNVTTPTLNNITDALGATNQAQLVENDFTALGTNGAKFWQIFYDATHGEFFEHELVRASNNLDINTKAEGQLVLESTTNVGNGLNRQEIEDIIIENGYGMPQRNLTFLIVDSQNSVFRVSYLNNLDEYAFEKLAVRV